MADDRSSNKRRKTASETGGGSASGEAASRALELGIEGLRSEVARLRQDFLGFGAEVVGLRQQLQLLRGNHEVLPLVAQTPTVDLSRFDTVLVAQISSFVGTSRELLSLALTCKSFGWRQPTSGRDWSLAEEAARGAVSSGQNKVEGARITLSPYVRGTATWLSILNESEHPLKFDKLLGCGIKHVNEQQKTSVLAISVNNSNVPDSTAIASNYVMVSGVHYADFQITAGIPQIGIVRPMPHLHPVRYAHGNYTFFVREIYGDFSSTIEAWGSGKVHLCQYYCITGSRLWTDFERERWDEMNDSEWAGMEECQAGDTIGMLMNLVEGTLTVYKNNRRLGVMKDDLSGSYCWFTGLLSEGDAVAINRGHPPGA